MCACVISWLAIREEIRENFVISVSSLVPAAFTRDELAVEYPDFELEVYEIRTSLSRKVNQEGLETYSTLSREVGSSCYTFSKFPNVVSTSPFHSSKNNHETML